jgi:hypothetical protein
VNSIYLIGSLRNDKIPEIAKAFREGGIEVFDDWYAAGPEADDYWKSYETSRGRTYKEALEGYAAGHVFDFDFHHLNRVDGGVLVLPAGKSAHIEFGYLRGLGKPAYVLFPGEPAEDRWDVMYRFATGVFYSVEEALAKFAADKPRIKPLELVTGSSVWAEGSNHLPGQYNGYGAL